MEIGMARKPRKTAQGMTHHCYAQCRGRRNLLLGRLGKKIFIEAVLMCQEKYGFYLIAAEIVANHIHLIIQTLDGKESISRIMQYILARIAEKYNYNMNESGPFWNGRFGSTVIEESENPDQYLLWLLWYIGFNPVRKGISRDPRKNDIGFINRYLCETASVPVRITLHEYYTRLGNSFEECVRKFLFYEEAYRKRLGLMF